MSVTLPKTSLDFSISYDGSLSPPFAEVNILGITATSRVSWKPQVTMIAKSASKTLSCSDGEDSLLCSYSIYIRNRFLFAWSTALTSGVH